MAYSPGTEITATLDSGCRVTASRRERGSALVEPSVCGRAEKAAASPAASASWAASSCVALTTMKKSLAPTPSSSDAATPSSPRVAMLAGVPIAALAHSTPSRARIARMPLSCTTEST